MEGTQKKGERFSRGYPILGVQKSVGAVAVLKPSILICHKYSPVRFFLEGSTSFPTVVFLSIGPITVVHGRCSSIQV